MMNYLFIGCICFYYLKALLLIMNDGNYKNNDCYNVYVFRVDHNLFNIFYLD